MKKYIAIVIANVIITAFVAQWLFGQSGEITPLAYRFTFVCPLAWDNMAYGMAQADEELGTNTKFVGFKSQNVEKQIDALQKAIYSKVNGIITAGTDNTPELTAMINEAVKEGIPVVLVDSDLPESDRVGYIGADNCAAGRLAGEDMTEATGGTANIGIIVSSLDNANQRERVEGFQEAIKDQEGMEVLQILECDSDRMTIRKQVEQLLKDYPQINALYCTEGVAAEMVGDILKTANRSTEEFQVVCFGLSDTVWQYLQEGRYYSAILQESSDQGHEAVKYLKDYINGKQQGGEVVYTDVSSAKKDFDYEAWKNVQDGGEVVWNLL